MFEQTGIPSIEMVMEKFPSLDRINKGPVAVVECYKKIPCNPCQTACKFDAINVGEDINNIPEVNTDNCTGCAICLSKCPGLAIMVVDGSKSNDKVLVKIPYEFLPLPEEGKMVKGLDREGNYLTDVKVLKVLNPKSFDRTPVITVEVDRKYMYDFRNIKVEV
ncbi:Fe-S-cluster-containing hydrogenase component 2 [Sedimentibacter acidaminivorans]|uniref:Fe-S-cluster-containing hydrogenase component 2 n=1 Tax=Sedimentibacter acidaminivorans TaxID=913099 RepID=A0ABS4GBJ4_9FIRM|nr:4Fe-4S binding protein [Sedimentibacter acidaminivorans]MBP1925055.1 Fe-S-cluster-containing hydrogenase component 2 [Sedimentibacter acidaminivorans]